MNIRRVSFGHPDAVRLSERVQREYAERYGDEGDTTFLEPGMFEPPRGLYLVVYDATGTPVATGGWRGRDGQGYGDGDGSADDDGYADGDAEIKRMYVVPEARGRGVSRLVLGALEDDARAAGRTRMVLETSTRLPEALSLYISSGYEPCATFGPYRFNALSRCYAKPLATTAVGPVAPPRVTPLADRSRISR